MKHKVLFLCTGNSCRSQMAEAVVNQELSTSWQAYSAGTHPAGYVHPYALLVLEEIGIEHNGVSKNVDQFCDEHLDLVITVCDSAAKECPNWLGSGERVHISYPDPAKAEGSEHDKMQEFRQVRDDIAKQIPEYLLDYNGSNHQLTRLFHHR